MDINSMPIAIFDSGFGGITVLKQLLKILPNENYIYVGDNANIPYGSKSKEEIINLTLKIVDFLVEKKSKIIKRKLIKTHKKIEKNKKIL